MSPSESLEILGYDVASWLAAYRNDSYPIEQLGTVTVDVTRKLRTMAIVVLLSNGDVDAWCHNLIRSARCRQIYLSRLAQAGIVNDHHQASARIAPFLDAIAAAQFTAARRVVAVSLTHWLPGHEYEDDFAYAQVLHGLISPVMDTSAIHALLDRMTTLTNGKAEPRVVAVRAIVQRDQLAFGAAFEGLLQERTRQIDAERHRNRIEDVFVVAERQIFVEGLALLQIADRLGLKTEREYQYCPSLARQAMQRPFPGE